MPDYFLTPEDQERIKKISEESGLEIEQIKREALKLGIAEMESAEPEERL